MIGLRFLLKDESPLLFKSKIELNIYILNISVFNIKHLENTVVFFVGWL